MGGKGELKSKICFQTLGFTFLKQKKEEQEQSPIKKQPELFSKSRFYGSSLALRKDLYSLRIIGPLKPGYFEDPTPAIQVQTLPLEGPSNFAHSWPTLRALERSKSYQRFVSG